ncbi:CubicO group peptidase (beta-lactamase class C family) [Skermanella aerolata]|uniref:serine hydrolase domain-containing protein n=1 Tax=Skermanella aerolata TaxID=393310 RepID=UPI003D198C04
MMNERLDTVIDRAIEEERIVGTVVLVAEDGQVVYRRAAGFADREDEVPVREDTVFRFASLTKAIVSVAALALIERGDLRLDGPVTDWIPSFRPRFGDEEESVITVRHLMTHTSGLTYGFMELPDSRFHRAGVSDGLDQPGLSMEENLRRISSVPLNHTPGRRWNYSVATDVLGEVIARCAGIPLPDLVERLVTGPLGMRNTSFRVGDGVALANPYGDGDPRPEPMAEPHRILFGRSAVLYSPARAFDAASFPSGGGGMVGTAPDFLAFLEVLRTGGAPVLKPESVLALTTNAIGDLRVNAVGPGWGFGLGVAVLKDPVLAETPESPGTWRWGGAYGHSWFVDPVRRLSMVALTNTAIAGMNGPYPDGIRDAVYGVVR